MFLQNKKNIFFLLTFWLSKVLTLEDELKVILFETGDSVLFFSGGKKQQEKDFISFSEKKKVNDCLKKANTILFMNHSIKLLKYLKILKIFNYKFACLSLEMIDWVNDETCMEVIKIEYIGELTFNDCSVNILKKMVIKKITILHISLFPEKKIPGTQFKKEFQIKEIKEVNLFDFASMFLKNLVFTKIRKLFVRCCFKESIAWANDETFKIEGVSEYSFYCYASILLAKTRFNKDVMKVTCYFSSNKGSDWLDLFESNTILEEIKNRVNEGVFVFDNSKYPCLFEEKLIFIKKEKKMCV